MRLDNPRFEGRLMFGTIRQAIGGAEGRSRFPRRSERLNSDFADLATREITHALRRRVAETRMLLTPNKTPEPTRMLLRPRSEAHQRMKLARRVAHL